MTITTSLERFSQYCSEETFQKIRPFESVSAMWKHCAEAYADLPAIRTGSVSRTFAELEKNVAHMRAALNAAGLKKGDRVTLLAPNGYTFVVGSLAAITAGLCVAVLPAHLDERAVFGLSMKFGAKGILFDSALEARTSLAAALVRLPVELSEENSAPAVDMDGQDECVILLTGGTTGRSKGALLSHANILQGVMNSCYGYKDVFNQRYLLVLPLSHVFGFVRNLMASLYTGSEMFICENMSDLFRNAMEFQPTILVVVPALAEMALRLCRQMKRDMLGSQVKYIICGAAVVPPYLVKAYAERGITLCPGYGLTESANLVSGNPEAMSKPTSVGLPYPNQELRIVDGELWLRGANVMLGYVNEPEENAAAFTDGWFRTGDLVRMDEEGFLYITGRIKEIIVLPTGENISPAEMETLFNELDVVQDSQVFEDYGADGGRILALEVVPRASELAGIEDPAAYITKKLQEVNQTLPSFMQVSRIEIRTSDFERTPSMKIVRYKKCN